MDRHTFLDALSWVRRVHEDEFQWPDATQLAPESVRYLLPPLSSARSVSGSQYASQNSQKEAKSCSACFHQATRICYFRAADENEDQTLFYVELIALERRVQPSALFVRFDHDRVFEVALSAIQSVILPIEPQQNDMTTKLPPFGGLNFGSVGLRLWLEPQEISPKDARVVLDSAMRRIEMLRSDVLVRSQQKAFTPAATLNPFRHNRWIAYTRQEKEPRGLFSVSELLSRGAVILQSDADKETLSLTVKPLTDRKRDRKVEAQASHRDGVERSSGEGASEEHIEAAQRDPESEGSDAISEAESFELVSSLLKAFGEKHKGLQQLLQTSLHSDCPHHDECTTLSGDQSSECVMQKWRKWDDFLQLAGSAFHGSNKRQRTNDATTAVGPATLTLEAGRALASAMLDRQQVEILKTSHNATSSRLRELENVAFTALFPTQADLSTTGTHGQSRTSVASRESHAPANPSTTALSSSIESTWNLLLESRRALVRHELTTLCLPRRAHEMATTDSAN